MEKYQEDENIDVLEIINQYLKYWKWFLFSIFIFGLCGFLYLKITPKQYSSQAKILLNNESEQNLLPGLKELSSIIESSDSQIEDQIEILKSRRLITKVVDKLDLNIQYYQENKLQYREVFKDSASIKIKFLDNKSKFLIVSPITFKIKVISAHKFLIINDITNEKINGVFGKPLKIQIGEILIFKNLQAKIGDETKVLINPIENIVHNLKNSINVNAASKKGKIIGLEMISVLPQRANGIINLLISQYNDDKIEDIKLIGNNTINFINERLSLISKELGINDDSMENFKSNQKITDVISEGQTAITNLSKINEQLKQYKIQLSLINYMGDFVKVNDNLLIPSNIGLTDNSIIQTTQQYNQLVLERDNLLKSSTEENPVIKNINKRIIELKYNLDTSLKNYKSTTQISINNLEKYNREISNNISKLPSKERGFKDILRKQQTVEALYLLLLQKREEAEIATASTPRVVKIVDEAYFENKAVFPKFSMVMLASIIMGFILPFSIVYIKLLLNNKVQNKKDIDRVIKNPPIAAYIPRSKEKLVNLDHTNSPLAESFKILRTNINFFLPKDLSKCVYITSTIGGEGKTFICINLAITIGLTGKKVLIIEADIRKPRVRNYLGMLDSPIGITEYLSENILNINDTVLTVNINDIKIDLIPSGKKAPNPSELLMNGKFKEIIDYGYQNYDYIIVDTAPVHVVTDTLLITGYSDLILYVIRANYLPKNLLEIPNQLLKDKKIDSRKIGFVINDFNFNDKTYGYGYRYE